MTRQVNVAEAKTTLSQLLEAAANGEDVVIARAGRPIVRLVPVEAPPKRVLGFLSLDVDDEFFAPLSGDDLRAWDGGG